ncbi:MAG: DUF892 family protein [Alphaproteobacteria bacterium]|jgi:uncharacterized protein (TIGR02284 family)|nr:PA2169 family four-helix-bundle protein [Candidatus Jidaibacter sp.]
MTTFVGTQKMFIDAVKSLIELDYDAIEAYEAAINRLENEDYKEKLTEFKSDHERHVENLSEVIRSHGETPPDGPTVKSMLTQGKVVLGNMLGDKTILRAMLDNEKDTNTAYQEMLKRDDLWDDINDILNRGSEDEKKHKQWLESCI